MNNGSPVSPHLVPPVPPGGRSAEERAFLLAELMLELARVRPSEIPGGLRSAAIRAGLDEMIAELRGLLAAAPLPDDPAFRSYLEAARAVTP